MEIPANRVIEWRLYCAAPPAQIFRALTDPETQRRYWCETSIATPEGFRFTFIDGTVTDVVIVDQVPPSRLTLRYFDSLATFTLADALDRAGGTDLTLQCDQVPAGEWLDVYAGWLNVLLPLKAWVDHGIDLRNHDPARTWKQGYVDQ